jgi:hypothetical protein
MDLLQRHLTGDDLAARHEPVESMKVAVGIRAVLGEARVHDVVVKRSDHTQQVEDEHVDIRLGLVHEQRPSRLIGRGWYRPNRVQHCDA